MRKLVFSIMFAMVTAIVLGSCGNSTRNVNSADTAAVDTADTVVVDTVAVDSVK